MADKIRRIKYDCPLLGGVAKLKIRESYAKPTQQGPATYKGVGLEDCNSKDICGIRKPNDDYDWPKCPAWVILNKGGNL